MYNDIRTDLIQIENLLIAFASGIGYDYQGGEHD